MAIRVQDIEKINTLQKTCPFSEIPPVNKRPSEGFQRVHWSEKIYRYPRRLSSYNRLCAKPCLFPYFDLLFSPLPHHLMLEKSLTEFQDHITRRPIWHLLMLRLSLGPQYQRARNPVNSSTYPHHSCAVHRPRTKGRWTDLFPMKGRADAHCVQSPRRFFQSSPDRECHESRFFGRKRRQANGESQKLRNLQPGLFNFCAHGDLR